MLRTLAAFFLAVVLAACARLPTLGSDQGGDGFELTGRVAVRYGKDSASGRVQWRHSVARDDLLITNPLGQGVARISRDDRQFRLETSEGQSYLADDAESLTEQVLGWRLPLAGLPDWVQGRAAPGSPAERRPDPAGRLATLRQDGWEVEYQEYGDARPVRLRLTHPGVEIRLVIESMESLRKSTELSRP